MSGDVSTLPEAWAGQVVLESWEIRDAGRYWLKTAKHRAGLWNWTQTYSEPAYLAAVAASRLKPKIQRTMVATAATAAPQGVTRVSRQIIADEVGCRELGTITAHWKAAESAGFMVSKYRFNTSKIIQLTIPPGNYGDIADDVTRLPWPDKGHVDPPF